MKPILWGAAGTSAISISRFVIGVVLARQLGTGPFGMIAVATLILALGTSLSDFGLSTVIIQKPKLPVGFVESCHLFQTFVGLVLTVLWTGATPWLARVFDVAPAVWPLRLMGLSFLIAAIGQTPSALLMRNLRIKRLQAILTASNLVGYGIVSITLAALGFGVWSLSVAIVCQHFMTTLFVCHLASKRNGTRVWALDLHTLREGGRIVASGQLEWVITNMDSLLVGRFHGPIALALYNRAYFTAFSIAGLGIGTARSSVVPVVASATRDHSDTGQVLNEIITLILFLANAIFIAIALMADPLIHILYGEQWSDAAGFLAILSLAMPWLLLANLIYALLLGYGANRSLVRVQGAAALIAVISYLAVAGFSVVVMVWTVLFIYLVRYLMLVVVLQQHFLRPPSSLMWSGGKALLLSICCGSLIKIIDFMMVGTSAGAFERVLMSGVVGIVAIVSTLYLTSERVFGGIGIRVKRLAVTHIKRVLVRA